MLSRRRFCSAALAAYPATCLGSLSGLLLGSAVRAQDTAALITAIDLDGMTVLQGAGCNVTAMPGDDGALMIDGGLAANADALLSSVFEHTGNSRVELLINTHWHPEVTGANEAVGNAGGRIFAHEKTRMYLSNPVYSVTFDGILEPLPEPGIPSEVTRQDGTLSFSDEQIAYGYLPAAHTDGDLYVHFPQRDVLVTGGVVSAQHWPLIDHRNGAWYGGRVRALQWLAELVDPDSRVVPGDGRLMTGAEIVELRDIYLELFETLIGYMNRGFGPEDAAAANPLARFSDRYGDAQEFVYGAYRSMLIAYVPD